MSEHPREEIVSDFQFGKRQVFVVWKPAQKACNHVIVELKSGAFEVTCCHPELDMEMIKRQIAVIMQRKKDK